jgi:hypothetical protein
MKALRLVLLAIACMVTIGLALRLLHPGWAPKPVATRTEQAAGLRPKRATPTAAEARSDVLSRLADAPAYAPFFEKLRAVFPGDYTALVDQASESLANGGHLPNPDRLLTDAMRHLRQTRGILAAQSEPGPLSGLFDAQALVLDLLSKEDPGACTDFLYGNSSAEFMAFAATHRDAVEQLALANLDAITNGQAKRIEHEDPTQEDLEAIAGILKAKGLSQDQIAAVLDGKTFDPPLPAAQLCDAGRAYLHTLSELPEDARTRAYALSAALLARS